MPILTAKEVLNANVVRYGGDIDRFLPAQVFQKEYDRTNWQNFKRDEAQATWDGYLQPSHNEQTGELPVADYDQMDDDLQPQPASARTSRTTSRTRTHAAREQRQDHEDNGQAGY